MNKVKDYQEELMQRITTTRESGSAYHVEKHIVQPALSDREFRMQRAVRTNAIHAYGYTISNWIDTPETDDDQRSQQVAICWDEASEAAAIEDGYTFA